MESSKKRKKMEIFRPVIQKGPFVLVFVAVVATAAGCCPRRFRRRCRPQQQQQQHGLGRGHDYFQPYKKIKRFVFRRMK